MVGRDGTGDSIEIPRILSISSEAEFANHQELLFRHIDFLIDALTAEQYNSPHQTPSGCPTATPELQCRSRGEDEGFPCRYDSLLDKDSQDHCVCGDSLSGTSDPLDTVAAVTIAPDDRTPGQRYFDTEYRQIIATLRANVGSWKTISSLDKDSLKTELSRATNRPGIAERRVDRLYRLVERVSELQYTEGVTLNGFGGFQYSSFADKLSDLPGISHSDAWWLMLVAFDKPVWPAGPYIDGMLCSLGLLPRERFQDGKERREFLEDELARRQIPQLHRAIAGHAIKDGIDVCGDSCESRKFFLTHRLRAQESNDNSDPVLIDLFSGAGGLSLGFTWEGWTTELAIDNDQDAVDTYRLNHPEIPHRKVICGDIREELGQGLVEEIGTPPDIVAGGPPCQSLSQAGYRARLSDDDEYNILEDDRTELYQEYVKVVEKLQPKALIMENVEGMVNKVDDTEIKVADLVIDALESIDAGGYGYTCDYQLIDAAEQGIPQHRERVVIFGVRNDLLGAQNSSVEELFDSLTSAGPDKEFGLRQALAGLPKLRRGEGGAVVPDRVRGTRGEYVNTYNLDEGTELSFNHRAREHPMEKDQILFDEALEPGDTGWDVKYAKDGEYADLIEYDVGTEENPRFKDKYRMLEWDEPAPTVVAHLQKDANNFVIPDFYEHVSPSSDRVDNRRNRGITPREAARLQSFPDEYIFLGTFTSWFRQIGNAVPPVLGKQIANTLETYLQSTTPATISQSPAERASTDD